MGMRIFTLTSRGMDRLQSSESDVCRRQILQTKVDPHTVRVKIFTMAVDPLHRYSNVSERAN